MIIDEKIIIVSNDCGYQQAINYLNNKYNKSINIINYNKATENVVEALSEIAVSQASVNIGELIKKSIPEIEKKNISKIINVKNESTALSDFHNRMRKAFGDELGREMYSKLKINIKSLF